MLYYEKRVVLCCVCYQSNPPGPVLVEVLAVVVLGLGLELELPPAPFVYLLLHTTDAEQG